MTAPEHPLDGLEEEAPDPVTLTEYIAARATVVDLTLSCIVEALARIGPEHAAAMRGVADRLHRAGAASLIPPERDELLHLARRFRAELDHLGAPPGAA